MESVDFMDKYLDPPEGPEKFPCKGCDSFFEPQELSEDDLCPACDWEKFIRKIEEGESEDE